MPKSDAQISPTAHTVEIGASDRKSPTIRERREQQAPLLSPPRLWLPLP